MGDRITEIRVEGLRTIERLTLPLTELTVLIGENGTGKSSILEACELLRRAAGPDFLGEFHGVHGGMFALLRDGASELRLGVRVESDDLSAAAAPPIDYTFALIQRGVGAIISDEVLDVGPYPDKREPLRVIRRTIDQATIYSPTESTRTATLRPEPSRLVLASSGLFSPHPSMERLRVALASIEVHLGFEVLPLWAARAFKRRSDARGAILLEPATQLAPLGANLANVFYTLHSEFGAEHWRDTMECVRMGLGPTVEEVGTRADPGGGAIALTLKLRGRSTPLPASALSDGQLAFLAFVGLYRLHPERALLCIDEPELHLHPGLLTRVVEFLATAARRSPCLLATHSDHLLDVLEEPARSVRLCDLHHGRTRLRGLDPEALAAWLEDYRGLGAIRADGYMASLLEEEG